MAPHLRWAAHSSDIIQSDREWTPGIGATDRTFRDQAAMVAAMKKNINAMREGFPAFDVTSEEDWARINSADPLPVHTQAQKQEFDATAGSPRHPSIVAPADLNVFMRMPGERGVTLTSNAYVIERTHANGRHEPELSPGKVKEIILLWGASAFRSSA